MKHGRMFLAGMISLALVFGLVFVGCDNGSGGGSSGGGGNGNEIDGGIRVIDTQNGIQITLDHMKIPNGTDGIQYYIEGPGYTRPVQIWFSVDEIVSPLLYPFTEAGSKYTVKAQYTNSTANEPMTKPVTVTARGGEGDIQLRNSSTVTYRSSDKSIEINPEPSIRKPQYWDCSIGLLLYLADDYRPVYYYSESYSTNATTFSLYDFLDGYSWDGGRPLSSYDTKKVYVEVAYYFPTGTGIDFKIVIGNTSQFNFPYM